MPCTIAFTASSTTLPFLVRGMSGTCTMRAGTWRGVVLSRIWRRMRSSSAASSAKPGAQLDEQHHARVARLLRRPQLADRDRFLDLVDLLDLAVDLGGADAHAARIQRRIRAPVDDHGAALGELAIVAVAPDVRDSARNRRRGSACRRGSFQKPTGIDGNGRVQTSSPFCPTSARPSSSQTSTFMPRLRHCSSPRYTGRIGLASAKQPMMSVPPEIDDRHTSRLISR